MKREKYLKLIIYMLSELDNSDYEFIARLYEIIKKHLERKES